MKIIFSLLCVFIFSFFLNVCNVMANDFGNVLENNELDQSKTNNSYNNDENKLPKSSLQDIFGDEQAFPFIAGLGKNSAH